MPEPIYVLRHGQTEWNRERRVQGSSESTLTPLGVRQAEAQGRILTPIRAATPQLRLYCSPLIRTRETARHALPDIDDRQIMFDPRLAEVSMGAWEGHLRVDLEKDHPILADPLTSVFAQCLSAPGGERFEDVLARVEAFLETIDGPSIIVTHGITGAVLRGVLLGLDFDGMSALDHGQGCVYRIDGGTEVALTL